ncbi:hypothetical protein HWV62_40856 [Athelia sp. TMB]|nr:hypothetical protein HWV62_40856 [Athelia sp. TMB]
MKLRKLKQVQNTDDRHLDPELTVRHLPSHHRASNTSYPPSASPSPSYSLRDERKKDEHIPRQPSKALAGEVRILLAEVGKLRDERRQLQYEIAELMSVKSKHGSGGEYNEGWMPPNAMLEPPPAPSSPAPTEHVEPAGPARPAWRVVHKRPERKPKAPKAITQGGASPSVAPVAMPSPAPAKDLPAWAQWRPNPLLSPAPQQGGAVLAPPSQPVGRGLFGPPTPPPS